MSRENSLLTGGEVAQGSVDRLEAHPTPEDRGCLHRDYGTISELKIEAF